VKSRGRVFGAPVLATSTLGVSDMDSIPEDLELKRHSGDDKHLVAIEVDGNKYRVRRGDWIVSDLKATVGVDPAKVLAEITQHGLKDLEDGATIKIHEHEKFMSHARSGGSA
jgi:hypothetical protein